jgi:RNA-directed DNA polymerase
MALLQKCYAKLQLKVNGTKSAVAGVAGRKGYSIWFAKEGAKRRVADKPMATFKQLRQLTRRSGGRSMAAVIERLRPYLLG